MAEAGEWNEAERADTIERALSSNMFPGDVFKELAILFDILLLALDMDRWLELDFWI